ncbi:ArsR/SmtB family transcription factor [Streptomyces radicis]|uniref:Transcriptional regulator n=1 Tax=Streptomyces radicis TaxID=1750517 RepID=A0A3A9WH74_9ACTN|nr:helix-turn-helix domain-containing protein [Streptomyces radicis]RKN11952.1 transcriptional regulator [Streptomyces radicis]RKN25997.1 transcriptional regulator [Streptomyces radicis]
MLRIHLTGEDLARIRVADRPDPLWETVLSTHRFRDRRGAHVYGGWREGARRRLGALPGTLRALIPPTGYFPDFLNPPQAADSWDSGLDALRATPRRRLAAEIARLDPATPFHGWLRTLAGGDREAVEQLATDLARYHRTALQADASVWARVHADVAADRAVRARDLMSGGAQGLLEGMRPVLRWNAPVLEAPYPVARDLHPGGRGLLLVPSFFCSRRPVTYADDGQTPVLVYPIEHAPPTSGSPMALPRLLGTTRARVLRCIGSGTTTGELARSANVSPASASQHARVLRDAGLIHSTRRGSEVLHTLTPLGLELLT